MRAGFVRNSKLTLWYEIKIEQLSPNFSYFHFFNYKDYSYAEIYIYIGMNIYWYWYTFVKIDIFGEPNYLLKPSENSESDAASESWRKRIEIFLYKEIGKDFIRFTQKYP